MTLPILPAAHRPLAERITAADINAIAARVNLLTLRSVTNAPRINLWNYSGIDPLGVGDSTAGIIAALADTPDGGCLEVPTGVYKHSPIPAITKNALRIVGVGGPSYNESPPYFGSAFVCMNQAVTGWDFGSGGFLMHSGVTLENLNFIESSGGTRTSKLVHVRQQNRVTFRNCSFRNGLVGIEVDGSRNDGTQIDASWFMFMQCIMNMNATNYNFVKSYGGVILGGDCQSLAAGAGVGIAIDAGTRHVRMIGLKGDGGGAIVINGAENQVIGGEFESEGVGVAIIRIGATAVRNKIEGVTLAGKPGHSTLVGLQIDTGALDTARHAISYANLDTPLIDNGTITNALDSVGFKWSDGVQQISADDNGVVIGLGSAPVKGVFTATKSWSPGTLANGAVTTTTLVVSGAAPGDGVVPGFSGANMDVGCQLTAQCTGFSGICVVTLRNDSGASITFGTGTLRLTVLKL